MLVFIFLDVLFCVFELLSNRFSPFRFFGDIVRCSPSLSVTSLPIILIVIESTNSIAHRCPNDDPEFISNWIVLFIPTSLFLKHLNSPSKNSSGFIVFL